MVLHVTIWAPICLQRLAEFGLHGLHFGRDGLEGTLVALLFLQGFIQRPLLLIDLVEDRTEQYVITLDVQLIVHKTIWNRVVYRSWVLCFRERYCFEDPMKKVVLI